MEKYTNSKILEYINEYCEITHSPRLSTHEYSVDKESWQDAETFNASILRSKELEDVIGVDICIDDGERNERILIDSAPDGPFTYPLIFLERLQKKEIHFDKIIRGKIYEKRLEIEDYLSESLAEYDLDYKKYFMLSMFIVDYVDGLYIENETEEKVSTGNAAYELRRMMEFISKKNVREDSDIIIKIGKGSGSEGTFRVVSALQYIWKNIEENQDKKDEVAKLLGINHSFFNARDNTSKPRKLSLTNKKSAFWGEMRRFLDAKGVKKANKIITQTLYALGISEHKSYRDVARGDNNKKQPRLDPLISDIKKDKVYEIYRDCKLDKLKNTIYNDEQ